MPKLSDENVRDLLFGGTDPREVALFLVQGMDNEHDQRVMILDVLNAHATTEMARQTEALATETARMADWTRRMAIVTAALAVVTLIFGIIDLAGDDDSRTAVPADTSE